MWKDNWVIIWGQLDSYPKMLNLVKLLLNIRVIGDMETFFKISRYIKSMSNFMQKKKKLYWVNSVDPRVSKKAMPGLEINDHWINIQKIPRKRKWDLRVEFDYKVIVGTSLLVQRLRICLPVQGTQVWSLVWEDSTCCGAAKSMCRHYCAESRSCVP